MTESQKWVNTIFVQFCTTSRLGNVMIYTRQLLDIFSQNFSIYRGVKFAIVYILHEWLLTQHSALPCICVKACQFSPCTSGCETRTPESTNLHQGRQAIGGDLCSQSSSYTATRNQ